MLSWFCVEGDDPKHAAADIVGDGRLTIGSDEASTLPSHRPVSGARVRRGRIVTSARPTRPT